MEENCEGFIDRVEGERGLLLRDRYCRLDKESMEFGKD
jgi:hypothetical protein